MWPERKRKYQSWENGEKKPGEHLWAHVYVWGRTENTYFAVALLKQRNKKMFKEDFKLVMLCDVPCATVPVSFHTSGVDGAERGREVTLCIPEASTHQRVIQVYLWLYNYPLTLKNLQVGFQVSKTQTILIKFIIYINHKHQNYHNTIITDLSN